MGNDSKNSSHVVSNSTRLPNSPGPVDELQRDVLESFSEVETIRLSRVDTRKAVYFGSVLLKEDVSNKNRAAIAGRLITRFVDHYQALILPIFENSEARSQYESDIPNRLLFDPISESELAVYRFSLLKESPSFPKSIRRWYLPTIQGYSDALKSILSSESVPSEIALTACLEMVQGVFVLLFATKGKVFSHDADAMVFYRDQFVHSGSRFFESDLLLYFQLLALKHRVLSTFPESTIGHRREFESLTRPIAGLFKRFKRYTNITYTSDSEKRFRRRFAFGSLLGIVLAALLFVLVDYTVALITIKNPVHVDEEKSGGIVGEYYKGRNFGHRILSRVDKQISFHSKGRLDPKLRKDRFSIRWNGYLKLNNSGKQRICLTHDDGCRLFFGEDLVIDDWRRGRSRRTCETINARKGWHPIRVEYFEHKGEAELRLLQGETNDRVKIVSARDLCCVE